MSKIKYYSLDRILKHNADYNVIYGERSNGKTTAVLEYALKDFCESGYKNQLAIVRRWEEDFKGKNGSQLFKGVIKLKWVEKYTKGEWNSLYYYSQRWYLACYDETGKKIAQMEEPFAYAFSITMEEHYKSTSYDNIKTILFDEFITRTFYLPDEFIKFQNLLSTLIRLRTDVKIFMLGNTVNKYCPYFSEMGLSNIKNQEKGTIDLYRYGDSDLLVAVEYSDFAGNSKKASNKYFAFNNPKLEMIKHGTWEIDIYPHLPKRYAPKDVVYIYYVIFDEEILQGNVICVDNEVFIYYHRKTTPIREDNKQLVYQKEVSNKRNYRTNILKPYGDADKKIALIIRTGKVFYQDNEVGELMRNYLHWCLGSD